MKFFIIGGYVCGNPGDEAILKSTVYYIHENFPKSFFYIWNENKEFRACFDRPIRHQMVFWKLPKWMYQNNFTSRVIVKLYTSFFLISKKIAMALYHVPHKLIHSLRDSDKVIFLGGGYLNSHYSLLKMNYLACLARDHNKPLLLFGQTLGPFEKKSHERIASEIFDIAKVIVIRDQNSEREAIRFKDKILRGVDDAVGFKPKINGRAREAMDAYFEDTGVNTVYGGINLRRWGDSRTYYSKIAEAMKSLNQLLPHSTIKWFFVPMEASAYCDDRDEGDALVKALENSDCDVTVIRESLSVEEKYYFLSRLDFFVGMRLHSLIFALNAGIPSIGIYHNEYYRRKIFGLLKSFGMEEFAIPLEKVENMPALIGMLFEGKEQLKKNILERNEGIMRRQQLMMRNILEVEA